MTIVEDLADRDVGTTNDLPVNPVTAPDSTIPQLPA
jgi:hypothetical protein